MGMMDNVQDKMGDMSEEAKQRTMQELQSKKDSGELDDKGHEQLNKLKEHFGKQ